MKKHLLKTMLLLCALVAGSSSVWGADPEVTLDFTNAGTDWKIPTSGSANKDRTSFTNGDYTIYLCATTNYKANSGYLILGKKDSYLELPAFDFDVDKIEVLGHSGASASVKQNIYVGNTAVSTETEGASGKTNSYTIASGYQTAGTIYKFVVTSAHNTQIDYIKIYKKTTGGADPVAVTGVTVAPSEWEMEVGETKELTATVAPAEATNKNVSWSSDDESVATVSDAGVVTAVAAGTANITVTTTDGSKTATCAITVKPAASVVVTLDFSTNAWGISESPTKTVDATEFTSGGYTITLAGSTGNGYYFDTDNIMLGKSGATLTLPAFGFNVSKIKVYGKDNASGSVSFNIFVGDDAVSTAVTSSKITQEFVINAEKRAVGTVYVIKVTNSNNMRISKIEIYGNGCEAGVVTDAGWATYVTTQAMRFAEGEAFAVTATGSGSVTLTEVTDVPNNYPVLLKGEGAKTAIALDTNPSAPANELLVSDGSVGNGVYVLANKTNGVGFYKWAGGLLTSGKVYLPAPAAAPKFLGFALGGETTDISEKVIVNSEKFATAPVYNLAGQRVAQPTKGLYIVNGKKVIMK